LMSLVSQKERDTKVCLFFSSSLQKLNGNDAKRAVCMACREDAWWCDVQFWWTGVDSCVAFLLISSTVCHAWCAVIRFFMLQFVCR
jgi:hypothetical protein